MECSKEVDQQVLTKKEKTEGFQIEQRIKFIRLQGGGSGSDKDRPMRGLRFIIYFYLMG